MASEKYIDLLRDPRWQRKRLEALEAGDWKCCHCSTTTKPLNVHHKKYRKGAKPWEYDLSELEVRCDDCHKDIHALQDELSAVVAKCSGRTALVEELIAYATTRVILSEVTGELVRCDSEARLRGVQLATGAGRGMLLSCIIGSHVDPAIVEQAMMVEWLRRREVGDKVTPVSILAQASEMGLHVELKEDGNISVRGTQDARDQIVPLMRRHKSELVTLLKTTSNTLSGVPGVAIEEDSESVE